jgi:GST-like protein
LSSSITVWSTKATGAAIAECFLALSGIPFRREVINYEDPADHARLVKLNPLGQVPTLVLPNGEILTETLAIMNWCQRQSPDAPLIPKNYYVKFQRWVTMIVAAVYPTWTYGDTPSRWVSGEEAMARLRETTDEHRKNLWLEFEKQTKEPYFLGDQMSAIDLYLAVMIRWRPGRKWASEHTPKLLAIAERIAQDSRVSEVIAFHFGK